jgi:curved DNA-binding protein CbpA
MALYILTNSHRSSEGLYRLPKYYIAGDLSISPKEVTILLDKLIRYDFIQYDEKNSIIFIKKALKYAPARNKNHQISAVKKLDELPKTYLFQELLRTAEKYNLSFADFLKKERSEFFKNQSTDAAGVSNAINNGMIDGIDDAISDDIGDSLELELALAQELTPTLKLKQEQEKTSDEIDQRKLKAKELTVKLIDLIHRNNPRALIPEKKLKNPLFKKWLTAIERLERLGPIGAKTEENKGYEWEEIEKIIEFSQNDSFWKSNILSASKLRKQIVVLENQMKNKKSDDNSEAKIDMLAELYAEAENDDLND